MLPPPAGAAVYAPVVARDGAAAAADDAPAPPGFLQFAIPDDQMPASSSRSEHFTQLDTLNGATTDRVGEFCYLCNSSATTRNTHHEQLCKTWAVWQRTRPPSVAAAQISSYYNRFLRKGIPGEPEWAPDTVYRHFTQHVVSETNTLVERARQLREIATNLVNTSSRVDQNGKLVRVNDSSIKSLLAVIAAEQTIHAKLSSQQ